MTILAFLLECAAVGFGVSAATSLLALAASSALHRFRPAVRADLGLVLALAPAIATLGVLAATALPPLTSALGFGPADDCFSHAHHGHLCLIHLGAPRPALMVLGAAAIALFLFRSAWLTTRLTRAHSDVAALERLGQPQGPIVWLPGAPKLCLATGVFRRRVLVSASLGQHLSAAELRAALAHETAHLDRRDPLTSLLVQLGALGSLPGIAGLLARRQAEATEQACDESAARAVGEPAVVAEALVKVARLAGLEGPALAFGRGSLESRVRALLRLSSHQRGELRLPLLGAAALVFVAGLAVLVVHSDAVHHAVETALHDLL